MHAFSKTPRTVARLALFAVALVPALVPCPAAAEPGRTRTIQENNRPDPKTFARGRLDLVDFKEPSIFHDPAEDTPDAQLARAKRLEERGRHGAAASAYDALVHEWHNDPSAPVAQLGVARMFAARGKRVRAFQEYQYAIDFFQGSFDFNAVIEEQFKLASELRAEIGTGFLGMGGESSVDGVANLFRLVARNAPDWSRAPDCYLQMGLTYEENGKYDEATQPYESLLMRYPTSPAAEKAMFRLAMCRAVLAQKFPRDSLQQRFAVSALRAVLAAQPDHPEADRAKKILASLESHVAQLDFEAAAFYDRPSLGKPKSALIAYRSFLRQHPDSAFSKTAIERIQALQKSIDESETP